MDGRDRLAFVRRVGRNAQCVDARWDKVLKRLINGTMAHYLRFAGKLRADHGQREMPAPLVAGMAGMLGAVIHDFEQMGFQHRQPLPNFAL